jgi:hypothetical protein
MNNMRENNFWCIIHFNPLHVYQIFIFLFSSFCIKYRDSSLLCEQTNMSEFYLFRLAHGEMIIYLCLLNLHCETFIWRLNFCLMAMVMAMNDKRVNVFHYSWNIWQRTELDYAWMIELLHETLQK